MGYFLPKTTMSQKIPPTDSELEAIRRERYRRLAGRLAEWCREDPAYDERVGEILERELKTSQLRCRE